MTRFEMVLFFQKTTFFENIPGITLSHLSDISQEIRLKEQDSLVLDEKRNNFFFIVVSGTVDFYQRGEKVTEFTQGQFIGEMLVAKFCQHQSCNAMDVVILKFNMISSMSCCPIM
jgi:signal-transduction protein with cAMP-binding, CBS, and nucleotidyltransferase domain